MEIFLKIFLLIVIVKLSKGSQDLMRVEESGGEIPGYIRDLIKDFNRKDSNIHDVAIIDLESESSEENVNRIIVEIPVENPVIIPNISKRLDDTSLRPASFVIILADTFDADKLYNKGLGSFGSNYCLNTAKFIFIGTKVMTDDDFYQVSLFLTHIGVLNVVMLNQNINELVIKTFNPYPKMVSIYSLEYRTDVDYVYQDKLIDLHGYTYEALAFPQMPRLYKLPNGEFRGIDVKLMQTVAEKQNANFNITIYIESYNETEFLHMYHHAMYEQDVDLTIATAIKSNHEYTLKLFKMVNTFDVNGYCALIPHQPRTSFLGQMLSPFDFYTWIVFIIAIGTCIIIWKLFNLMGNGREDSTLYFMYGIIAHFLLQTIPFRNNRIILRSLLQICIFMMFILGNAYQSLIISFISESRYGGKLNSFDELMQSNYSLQVDFLFYHMMNLTDDLSKKISIAFDLNFQQKAANNTAIILRCDATDYIMYSKEYASEASDYFYLLPDQRYTYYESFPTSKFSPHHEKLQYFSTLIFESGIRQHWEEQYHDIRGNIEANKINNEEYLINFDDLFGVFYLLGIGFFCAILALIFEIFWHDCLRHLNRKMTLDLMFKKKEENKMKVRRIQVKPLEMIEEETRI